MDGGAFIPIGRVVKPHGLSGEVSVRLEPGVMHIPAGVHVWFVPPPAGDRDATVTSVRQGPKGPLVTLEGISGVEAASALRGATMMVNGSDLPDGVVIDVESFAGFEVHDTERGPLGRIEETIVTGANDVWVVRGEAYGEVLIPVIEDVVISIDRAERSIDVRLLPGLIEEAP